MYFSHLNRLFDSLDDLEADEVKLWVDDSGGEEVCVGFGDSVDGSGGDEVRLDDWVEGGEVKLWFSSGWEEVCLGDEEGDEVRSWFAICFGKEKGFSLVYCLGEDSVRLWLNFGGCVVELCNELFNIFRDDG